MEMGHLVVLFTTSEINLTANFAKGSYWSVYGLRHQLRLICQSIFVQTVDMKRKLKLLNKTITDDDGKQYKIRSFVI